MAIAASNSATQARILAKLRRMTPEQRQRILSLAMPRVVDPYFAHIPHPKQQVFLTIQAREAMYGGAAGGGKSDALLMAALQYADVPGYSALLLRRTWPDLNSPGAILDRGRTWLGETDAREQEGGRVWRFPSGARLSFGYIQYDKDKYKYQSAEYQFIGVDELTQWEETTYRYLFSRIRRPKVACLNCGTKLGKQSDGKWRHTQVKLRAARKCRFAYPDPMVLKQYTPAHDGMTIFDIPLRMRSATNPGGIGHEWVKSRFVDRRTRDPKAVFVPALLRDNPSLDEEEYEEVLDYLLPVDRERLKHGDWDTVEEGDMFKRHQFKPLDVPPAEGLVVRFWDNAATAGSGDWTVGVKMRRVPNGTWVVEDVRRGQWSSLQKKQMVRMTALEDGRGCYIRMEQEPGSAGVDVIDDYRRNVLVGFNFDGERSTGDKQQRAIGYASAAEAGNVYMVTSAWNMAYLDEVCQFPFGQNDDQVDASSGAFNWLAFGKRSRLLA